MEHAFIDITEVPERIVPRRNPGHVVIGRYQKIYKKAALLGEAVKFPGTPSHVPGICARLFAADRNLECDVRQVGGDTYVFFKPKEEDSHTEIVFQDNEDK